MNTEPENTNHLGRPDLAVPLTAADAALLGGDGEQLATLLATALHGLALLRTGHTSSADLATTIEGTTGLMERLEAVRDASLRQPAAKDISHADLARAMHLESRATAQSRRRTLLRTPVGELERWATGTTD
ncbi:hypothetical protein OHA98_41345 [Streptomyces sp. NBC_00654]|uniref:hypothetical protein n=1 Tax=Streptomyces sp. NBC_00654 TaxID=2975799 RepID=UPI00225050C1|nr:hypothetical protein [Streptomyces sp. NBC_00654]MCX4971059.1 hypothetical protein [Streptomyces sp. NBC_00654]